MTPRILVVEDSQEWQQIFLDVFSTVGRVDQALDIPSAKRLLDQNRYGAIILDLVLSAEPHLPDLIPVETQVFLDFLATNHSEIPVVATTAYELSPNEFFRLRSLGPRDLILKSRIEIGDARDRLRRLIRPGGATTPPG